MINKTYQRIIILSLIVVLIGFFQIKHSQAENSNAIIKNKIDKSLKSKKQRVKELKGLISTYQNRIKKQENQTLSLKNQITLLESQIKEKKLKSQEIKLNLEVLALEIQKLDKNIKLHEQDIKNQKKILANLIRQINQADNITMFDVLLSKPNLSSYLNQIESLQQLQGDLTRNVSKVEQNKVQLQNNKKNREEKKILIEGQKKQLAQELDKLELEEAAKTSLLAQTQASQEEFSKIITELSQQNQNTMADIQNLQEKLKEELNKIDSSLARGNSLFIYPVPFKKITTTFHDPTYPFRHLFQHPGIDLRASVGTPVRAAGGGYVARVKLSRSYGNYVMLIHPGGLATIYAHLSKFKVKLGQYVQRGDLIGLSGGRPGDKGAGLSTGPHLHFEVRQGGIPVDPLGFLPPPPK